MDISEYEKVEILHNGKKTGQYGYVHKLYTKWPVEPLKKGWGWPAGLIFNKQLDKTLCLECGEFRGNLFPHLKAYHGLSLREYKFKYGYKLRQSLAPPIVQNKHIQYMKEHTEISKLLIYNQFQKPIKELTQRGQTCVQRTNELGYCRVQSIVRLREVQKKSGKKYICSKDIERFDKLLYKRFTYHFESIEQAIKYYRFNYKNEQEAKKLSERCIIIAYKNFIRKVGRQPAKKDFKSLLLPFTDVSVYNYFGSLLKPADVAIEEIEQEQRDKEAKQKLEELNRDLQYKIALSQGQINPPLTSSR